MKRTTFLGILLLTTQWIMGQNHSLNFDGLDDYIEIGESFDFSNDDAFTIEAWVIANDTNVFQQIVSKLDADFTGWGLQIDEQGNLSGYVFSEWLVNSIFTTGKTLIADGEWHHVAMTFQNEQVILYVDGVLEPLLENNQIGDVLNGFSNSGKTNIGSLDANGNPQEFYLGNIDEVRIWEIALTEEQINATYMTELSGNEAGLGAYFKMDQMDLECDVVSCNSNMTDGMRFGSNGTNDLPQYDTNTPVLTDVDCGAETECNLGLEENLATSQKIKLYPNPTSDIVNIDSSFLVENASIYGMSGKLVKQITNTNRFSIAELANGVYFLTIRSGNNINTRKIIKI